MHNDALCRFGDSVSRDRDISWACSEERNDTLFAQCSEGGWRMGLVSYHGNYE